MPINVSTLADNRILKFVLTDPWTMQELREATAQEMHYRDNAGHSHKIHSLIDLQSRTIPANSLQSRTSPSFAHPSRGQLVVCGATSFVKALAETVFRLVRFDKVRFFATEAEALAYLQQVIADEDRAADVSA